MRLSLAIVARDDADVIGRALASCAPVCDEMIVVDTGSRDATRKVAAGHGGTVHGIPWEDDYAAARNMSFEFCSGDWILWLDPADVLPPASQKTLAEMKSDLADVVDAVFCPYHGRFADDGRARLTVVRERLFRREAGLRWEGRAYEQVAVRPERAALHEDLVIENRPGREREARDLDRRVAIMSGTAVRADGPPLAIFFFANDLMYHERFSDAADAYDEYLDADARGGNRYWAQVSRAECLLILGDREEAPKALAEAILEDSSRAEAYVTLGRLRFDAGDWDEAVPLFMAATAATRPRFGFIRDADYGYLPWDFLSVCYDKLGRFHDALSAAERSLPGNPEADRIRANMHWMVDRL